MLAVAEALLAAGADVNDSYPYQGEDHAPLSALYGAIGHAGNMVLAEWLLAMGRTRMMENRFIIRPSLDIARDCACCWYTGQSRKAQMLCQGRLISTTTRR